MQLFFGLDRVVDEDDIDAGGLGHGALLRSGSGMGLPAENTISRKDYRAHLLVPNSCGCRYRPRSTEPVGEGGGLGRRRRSVELVLWP